MSESYQKFTEPKPPFFPFKVDVRPDRNWELETDFGEVLLEKIEANGEIEGARKVLLTPEQEAAARAATEVEKEADIKAGRELSRLASGLKFISREQKIHIELTESKFNHERIKEDDYLSRAMLLGLLPLETRVENGKVIRVRRQLPDEPYEGADATYLHNTNIYQALNNHNPFQIQDSKNYDAFENDPNYKYLNERFISPLQILTRGDPDLWAQMNDILGEMSRIHDSFNLKDIPDPYYANDVESIDMNFGYDSIMNNPAIYQSLTEKEVFFTTLSAYEDALRFQGLFQEIAGSGPRPFLDTAPPPLVDPIDGEATLSGEDLILGEEGLILAEEATNELLENLEDVDLSEFTDEELNAPLTDEELSLLQAESWWADIGGSLDNASKLLAIGLIPNIATSLSDKMDWSQGRKAAANIMVTRYFSYISETYMPSYRENGRIQLRDIQLDNSEAAEKIWKQLVEQGVISSSGFISRAFKENPNSFRLESGVVDDDQFARIHATLKSVAAGRNSFSTQDQSIVNGKGRKDIQIATSKPGEFASIADLINLINQGNSYEDKLQNTKIAYTELIKLYGHMTGASDEAGSQGLVKFEELENGHVLVNVSPKGQWQEWNPQLEKIVDDDGTITYKGGWVNKSGQGVNIEFESIEAAQLFADHIKRLTQILAPVLGLFAKDGLAILTNNVGSSDEAEFIREESIYYREQVVTFHRYDDPVFKQALTHISDKSVKAIGHRIFEKSQINKLVYSRHKKKLDEYWDKKEEHDNKEYVRLKTLAKAKAKRKATVKKDLIRVIKQRKRVEAANNRKQNNHNNRNRKKA